METGIFVRIICSVYSKQSMYRINDDMFSIWTYLINKKSTCYLWTVILRVDHRNTPTGRSVIYCLNKMFSQSCPRIEGKLNKTDFSRVSSIFNLITVNICRNFHLISKLLFSSFDSNKTTYLLLIPLKMAAYRPLIRCLWS